MITPEQTLRLTAIAKRFLELSRTHPNVLPVTQDLVSVIQDLTKPEPRVVWDGRSAMIAGPQ